MNVGGTRQKNCDFVNMYLLGDGMNVLLLGGFGKSRENCIYVS